MDRLTRDRKNNLQLSGNASISMLPSFESKTGKRSGKRRSFSSIHINIRIFISPCKTFYQFFINILEFRRKKERERENQEILLLVLTYLIRIPLVIRIRDIFPPRKILHYTRLLVKLLARCTHVYA